MRISTLLKTVIMTVAALVLFAAGPARAEWRKAETERLARTALRRQLALLDPQLAAWGD